MRPKFYRLVCILWLLSVVSVIFLDRSISLFNHEHSLDQLLFLRYITEGLPTIFPILIIWLIFYRFIYRDRSLLAIVSSFIVSTYFYLFLTLTLKVKTLFKIVFGRYWPTTWINNNLSLIHDGVYGFNWFHGFNNMGSFPSGHSTFTAFCCIWLMRLFPKLEKLNFTIMVIMPICLVLLNYHFLGDCFAGVGLGILCGEISIWLYEITLNKFK